MRFGLHTGQHHVAYAELADLWEAAGSWGFDACYLFDHFVPLHSDVEAFVPEEAHRADGPCLEGVTALAALARRVSRIGVGLMVAAVGYRAPGLLTRSIATLHGVAPGRVEVGIGAGWFEYEYRAFGLPFPRPRERMDQLQRALEIVRVLPIRLWVAGTGERRLLPLAARYADSWNAMFLTPAEFRGKVGILVDRCRESGRDPSSIERSIALRAFCATDPAVARRSLDAWAAARGRDPERLAARSLCGSPDVCADQLGRYADAGATHVAVMAHPPYDRDGLALLASEVFPSFR